MNKTNPMKKRFQNILLIVTLFLFFIFYFLLQPRVSNFIPLIREYRMQSFIKSTLKNDEISSQDFWQLREFYSPGTITFSNRNLEFKSQKSISKEVLVKNTSSLQTYTQSMRNYRIIFQKKNEIIAEKNGIIFINFIKPVAEMKKTNGFFDYEDKDKALLKDKAWFVSAQFYR